MGAYTASICSIFGGVLYNSASLFWIMDSLLTVNDSYTLITVGYFVGGSSFGIANYINFYKSFCAEQSKKVSCKSIDYWIALIFSIGSFLVFWPYLFGVMRIDFMRGSLLWHINRFVYTTACLCFFIGGALCVYANRLNDQRNKVQF